jgi:hypothetical protein
MKLLLFAAKGWIAGLSFATAVVFLLVSHQNWCLLVPGFGLLISSALIYALPQDF